jgi:hypothetical protein
VKQNSHAAAIEHEAKLTYPLRKPS